MIISPGHRLYFLLLLLLAGCSSQKPWYHARTEGWESQFPPSGPPVFQLFLIGDAGKSSPDHPEPTFALLESQIQAAGKENSAVVWLGDNLYPEGMVEEGHPERAECERRLQVQVDAGSEAGTVVFVPGNHDWKEGKKEGWEQVQRAEDFLEGYASGANVWLPDDGCPGPVEIPLGEDIVLLVIDTQWWLHKHDKPNAECESNDRTNLLSNVDAALMRNEGKRIVVAAHHPLFSYGAHGGHYSAATHLFPLLMAKENLYIPLPVLGTFGVLYRKLFGNIQDIPHKQYRQLRDRLSEVLSYHPNLIYAAGHDHGLQYFPVEEQHYIVSGAGSKTRWTGRGDKADFTYAHKGFCRLDFYEEEVWMEFWVPRDGDGGEVVFRRRLF